jgi:hypothetical protein
VEEFSVGEVLMQQQQESFTEIGRKHLPEYRAHFEKLTRAVVEHHVANRLFREDNKRFAALAWLNELEETEKQKQIQQDKTNATRWRVGTVLAVIAIVVGAYNAFKPLPPPPAPSNEARAVDPRAAKSQPPPKPKRVSDVAR